MSELVEWRQCIEFKLRTYEVEWERENSVHTNIFPLEVQQAARENISESCFQGVIDKSRNLPP